MWGSPGVNDYPFYFTKLQGFDIVHLEITEDMNNESAMLVELKVFY